MKTNQQFDPIVNVVLLPAFGPAAASSSPDAHTATVFVAVAAASDDGVMTSGKAPTLRERLRRRYWHYELDMTHHPVVLRLSLPAREEAFAFIATVTMLWAVQSPVDVALLGVRDVKPILWTFIDQTLRAVSRQFGIEEIQAAEAEMKLVLDKQSGEVGFGLRLSMIAASLRLDQDTERYLSERVQTGREGNLAVDRQGLAEQKAEYDEQQAQWRSRLEQAQAEWKGNLEQVQAAWRGRLEQAQASHQHDLERAQGAHQQDLEQAQAEHRQQLDAKQADHTRAVERLNNEHETELKSQRLTFYRNALSGGNHDVMVLQLIENPGDIDAVLRLIEAGSDKHYTRSREVLDNLLEHHLANAADVNELTEHTIGELRSALTALSPGRPKVIKEIEEGVDERVRIEEKDRHTDRIIRQTTM